MILHHAATRFNHQRPAESPIMTQTDTTAPLSPSLWPVPGFDPQPTLSDGAVRLRPMRGADRAALYEVARDPAIWALHPAQDRWKEDGFRAFFDLCLASGGALVIEDAASGAVIGASRYDRERAEAGEVEIGWTFLARDRWGGVTNGAVKRLMIAHALAHFDRVIFLIGAQNLRSRRAVEKIGGRLTPRPYDAPMAGRSVRHVIYAIDRAGFEQGPLMAR
jgi:N-acetyltransferase